MSTPSSSSSASAEKDQPVPKVEEPLSPIDEDPFLQCLVQLDQLSAKVEQLEIQLTLLQQVHQTSIGFLSQQIASLRSHLKLKA